MGEKILQYVVGWDGGGTKTAMQIRDLDGNILLTTKGGSLNYNSNRKEELCETIESLMDVVRGLPGGMEGCKSFCISAAGISNNEAVKFITEQLNRSGVLCNIFIVGDHEAALYGAFGRPEGIVLVSGTGSICFGMNKDLVSHRTGGYGHLIDDEGSGYAIGRDILTAAVRIYDKRIANSILLELVLNELGTGTVEGIVQYTYQSNWSKANIASLSPLLLCAIKEGDIEALRICERASEELVNLVLPVARILSLEDGQLSFLGGILTHYEPIRAQVIQKLSTKLPAIHIVEPKNDSVTGATLIALDRFKSSR